MGDMTAALPLCPRCSSPYTYELGTLLVCPECAHEWVSNAADASGDSGGTNDSGEPATHVYRDAVGNTLIDGDSVTVIKDLKVKGSSTALKSGTKVRSIRLLDPADIVNGHDIGCKVPGFGQMQLKSSVVKKL